MDKISAILTLAACLFSACQKAELQEPPKKDARSVEVEECDSVNVKPSVNSEGWTGAVDVGFGFG